jgi:hypothetical protein
VGSNPRLATFLPGTQFALDTQPGTTSARKPRFRLVIIMSGSGRRTNGFASTSLCSAMKRQERNLRVPACNERNGEGFRVPEAYESLPCRNPRSATVTYDSAVHWRLAFDLGLDLAFAMVLNRRASQELQHGKQGRCRFLRQIRETAGSLPAVRPQHHHIGMAGKRTGGRA